MQDGPEDKRGVFKVIFIGLKFVNQVCIIFYI